MPLEQPERRRALLLMVIAPLLWSTAGVVTRWLSPAMHTHGAGFELTFWRSVFAALFVSAWLTLGTCGWHQSAAGGLNALRFRFGSRNSRSAAGDSPTGRPAALIAFASGLCWTVMFCCFMLALSITTVANTLIVMCVSPLLTALLAWWLLGSRLPLRTWIAIFAAGVGIAVMFAGAAGTAAPGAHATGMLVALGVPVAAAINLVLLQRSHAKVDLIPAVGIGAVISSLLMLPFALPLRATPADIAWLAGLGVFQLGLPCVLLVIASRNLSAPQLSLLALLEVVLGPLWAWVGAGEAPGVETMIGGAVVVGAIAINELAGLKALSFQTRGA